MEAMPDLARRAAAQLREYVDSGRLIIENVAIAEAARPSAVLRQPGLSRPICLAQPSRASATDLSFFASAARALLVSAEGLIS